jgi:hypothetical protein
MLSPESQHIGDDGAKVLLEVTVVVVVLVMRACVCVCVPASAEGMLDAPAARAQLRTWLEKYEAGATG